MNATDTLNGAQELLRPWTSAITTPEANRVDVKIDVANLLAAIGALMEARWGYLAAITGLDLGVQADQIEVLYHFCAGAAVLTLRVLTDRKQSAVPSICTIIPSATFYERELREMLGVDVVGIPNADHLFLPDDWQDGIYPLRKDTVLD